MIFTAEKGHCSNFATLRFTSLSMLPSRVCKSAVIPRSFAVTFLPFRELRWRVKNSLTCSMLGLFDGSSEIILEMKLVSLCFSASSFADRRLLLSTKKNDISEKKNFHLEACRAWTLTRGRTVPVPIQNWYPVPNFWYPVPKKCQDTEQKLILKGVFGQ